MTRAARTDLPRTLGADYAPPGEHRPLAGYAALTGAFLAGYVHAPRATRLLAALWTIHAIADGVQLAYSAAEERS